MIQRRQIKVILDVVMTIALLFLMAIQVAGDKYHEWLGAGMLLLFVIHNVLNWKWYRTLFKGKYSAQRVVRAIVNLAVLVAIVLTGYSGIVLSRHVFAFLPIDGGMATARKSHLAGSYWAFVLMSIHLGMHWSMMTGKVKAQNSVIWVLKIVGMAIAFYGAVLFGRAEIFHNMFLQNAFAILDYETPGVLIILQNLAMMSMWIFVGHYLTRALLMFFAPERQDNTKKRHNMLQASVGTVAAVAVVVCAILSTPRVQSTESDYYGHYPYEEIEGNYFDQSHLTTQPGEYRETTVAVGSFVPNKWGLYNMHGNVSEWVWDYYGAYGTEEARSPQM